MAPFCVRLFAITLSLSQPLPRSPHHSCTFKGLPSLTRNTIYCGRAMPRSYLGALILNLI